MSDDGMRALYERNRRINAAAYGPAGEHEHKWGPLERSRFAGTVHRKCRVRGCEWVSALDDDDDDDDA